jgi:hypothetical protein
LCQLPTDGMVGSMRVLLFLCLSFHLTLASATVLAGRVVGITDGDTIVILAEGNAFTCGAKRFCRQMLSCGEAMFYLDRCGVARLDGDGDGIPCESLCR